MWTKVMNQEDIEKGSVVQHWECYNAWRVYLYTDLRWISSEDDNYGSSTENYSESAWTGLDPVMKWITNGMIVEAWQTLDWLNMVWRCNNSQVLDLEIRVIAKTPSYNSGYNNDNEHTITTLYSWTWKQEGISTTNKTKKTIPINHTFTQDSEISIFYKPLWVLTANRYFLHSYKWIFSSSLKTNT